MERSYFWCFFVACRITMFMHHIRTRDYRNLDVSTNNKRKQGKSWKMMYIFNHIKTGLGRINVYSCVCEMITAFSAPAFLASWPSYCSLLAFLANAYYTDFFIANTVYNNSIQGVTYYFFAAFPLFSWFFHHFGYYFIKFIIVFFWAH